MDLENGEDIENVADSGDGDAEMVEKLDGENSSDGVKVSPSVRQREDFTSEIYKIEISNMGNFGYGVRTICLAFVIRIFYV